VVEDFVVLLRGLMIEEFNYSDADADSLIKKYPDIIMRGIMSGNFALRATVMAIQMKEEGK
jgi:hypothetical protein